MGVLNEEIVTKKIGILRVERNRRSRSKLKKEWMEVIEENTRTWGTDEDTVSIRGGRYE